MAWEPSLARRDALPLGSADAVRQAITKGFPGTVWELAPGGAALLAEFERLGSNFSADWRTQVLRTPPRWHGIWDSEAVSLEFALAVGDAVAWVNVTSRGEHSEAQQRLRTVAREQGWVIEGDFSPETHLS
jgi:hypothetical protein